MKIRREEFVSEPITIDSSSVSSLPLSQGAPSCPTRFTWRGQEHHVIAILETGKQLRAYEARKPM
jgi:hypothetical protein